MIWNADNRLRISSARDVSGFPLPMSDCLQATEEERLVCAVKKWRSFTHPYLRRHERWEQLVQSLVAQFRVDYGRNPGDPQFKALVADLMEISDEFRSWWSSHDVKSIPDGYKSMNHPTLGSLDFEHITLQVPANAEQKQQQRRKTSEIGCQCRVFNERGRKRHTPTNWNRVSLCITSTGSLRE